MRVILSSPVLLQDGSFNRKTISRRAARKWVEKHRPTNYCTHQTVKLLGIDPANSREECLGYDEALIATPKGRLDHEREYSWQEIEHIGVDFVLITREATSQ
jgi:hypothetical protein